MLSTQSMDKMQLNQFTYINVQKVIVITSVSKSNSTFDLRLQFQYYLYKLLVMNVIYTVTLVILFIQLLCYLLFYL